MRLKPLEWTLWKDRDNGRSYEAMVLARLVKVKFTIYYSESQREWAVWIERLESGDCSFLMQTMTRQTADEAKAAAEGFWKVIVTELFEVFSNEEPTTWRVGA